MIALGSVNWGSAPTILVVFGYEKRRSGADMQYRTQVQIRPISTSSYFGYPIYVDVSIGGQRVDSVTVKYASPSQWWETITYTSAWHTVANKISGTTPVSFKIYSGSGSTRNNTYSYSMDVDPAASTVSASNGTLSTTLYLNVTRHNPAFTHTIQYTCGSVTNNVCVKSSLTTVAWDNSNGNVSALALQNLEGQSVDVTFTIITYDGAVVVGADSTTITMAIPPDVRPSVGVKVEDAEGYLDTYGAYVQGWSKLKITASVGLAHNSPIRTYAITADGKSYDTSPVITDVVQGMGILPVTAKVTDARSRSSDTASTDIAVLEYHKPSVNVIAYRCNANGGVDPEGAYMKVGFTATIASLNGKNSADYVINYGGTQITGSGTYYLSEVIACDVSYSRSVEVTVSDDLATTPAVAVIPVAFTLMDFHNSGEGVALGKVATRKGFDCAMDSYFGNKRLQEVGSPVADTDAVNKGYALATFISAMEDTTYPGCYYRMVGGVKEWLNPPMLVDVEYRTTERYAGKPVYVLMKDLGALPNAGSKTVENLSTKVDRIVDAVFNTATSGATYQNAQEVSWYVGSYGWPYCIMKTTIDMSAYTARITLKYTKTTD